MKRLACLLALCLPALGEAASVCPIDLAGTFPTTPGYKLPEQNVCYTCRELTRFPQDFSNESWNYIHNFYGAETVYNKYFGSLTAGNTATTTFRVRNISLLGQAANTSIITVFRLEHYTETSVAYCPVPSVRRVAIERWHLYTMLPDGDSLDRTYIPGQTPRLLPVPANTTDDGYDPKVDCLYNDGTQR